MNITRSSIMASAALLALVLSGTAQAQQAKIQALPAQAAMVKAQATLAKSGVPQGGPQ